MRKILVLSAVATALLGSGAFAKHYPKSLRHTHEHHEMNKKNHQCKHHKNMVYKHKDLVISKAYVRPTISENMPTAAYVTINNMGDLDDTLISVQSDVAEKVEIHNIKINDKGVMKMSPMDKGLALKAHSETQLRPRSFHIMLHNVSQILKPHTHIPLKLNFEKSGSRMISFEVAENKRGHGKHHHQHKKPVIKKPVVDVPEKTHTLDVIKTKSPEVSVKPVQHHKNKPHKAHAYDRPVVKQKLKEVSVDNKKQTETNMKTMQPVSSKALKVLDEKAKMPQAKISTDQIKPMKLIPAKKIDSAVDKAAIKVNGKAVK